ncbi:uncharacterized protein LOC124169580 [Ischnura elegans]|uniref:uncharacterized protein LOC124169580 n=1 Tax=Ischnura elegans TaxID=197161 RepID=UPI001ED8A1D0|nr:uncharacterized protein LOC124169580 [Ischnura elegans]
MLKWTSVGAAGQSRASRPSSPPPVPSRPRAAVHSEPSKEDTLEPGGGLLDRILAGWSQRKRPAPSGVHQRADSVPRRKAHKDRKSSSVKGGAFVKAKSKGSSVYATPARRRLVLSDVGNRATPTTTTTTASDSSPGQRHSSAGALDAGKSSAGKRLKSAPKNTKTESDWERVYTRPKSRERMRKSSSDTDRVPSWHGSQKSSSEAGKSDEATSQEKDSEEDEDKENSENWERLNERRRRRRRKSRRKSSSEKGDEAIVPVSACSSTVIGCSSYAATVSTAAVSARHAPFYSNCPPSKPPSDPDDCQAFVTPKKLKAPWESVKQHPVAELNKLSSAVLDLPGYCPGRSTFVKSCDNYLLNKPLCTYNSNNRFSGLAAGSSLSSAFTEHRDPSNGDANCRPVSSHYPDSAFVPYIPSQVKSSNLTTSAHGQITLITNPGYTSSSTLTSSEALTHGSYYPNPNLLIGACSTHTGTSSGIASSASSTKSMSSSCGPNSTLSSSYNPEIQIEYSPNELSYRNSILRLSQRLYRGCGSRASSPFIHPLLPPVAPTPSGNKASLRRRLTDDFDAPAVSSTSSNASGCGGVSPLARDLAWMQLNCSSLFDKRNPFINHKISRHSSAARDSKSRSDVEDGRLNSETIIEEELEPSDESPLPVCSSCGKNKNNGIQGVSSSEGNKNEVPSKDGSEERSDSVESSEKDNDYKPPVAPRTNIDCKCVRGLERTGYCNLGSTIFFDYCRNSSSKRMFRTAKIDSPKIRSAKLSCTRLPPVKPAGSTPPSFRNCSCPASKCSCLVPPPPPIEGYFRLWDATTGKPLPTSEGVPLMEGLCGVQASGSKKFNPKLNNGKSRTADLSGGRNAHQLSLLKAGVTPSSPLKISSSAGKRKKGRVIDNEEEDDGLLLENSDFPANSSFVMEFKKSNTSKTAKPTIGAGLCFPLPSASHKSTDDNSLSSSSSVTSSCPPSPSPSPVRRRPRFFPKHDLTDPKFLEKLRKESNKHIATLEMITPRRRRISGHDGGRDRKRSRRSQSQDPHHRTTPGKSVQKRIRRRSSSAEIKKYSRMEESSTGSAQECRSALQAPKGTSSVVCPVFSGFPGGMNGAYRNVTPWVLEGDEEPEDPGLTMSVSIAEVRDSLYSKNEKNSVNLQQKPWYAKLDDSVGSDNSKGKLEKNGSFLIPPSTEICDISTCHCKSANSSQAELESDELKDQNNDEECRENINFCYGERCDAGTNLNQVKMDDESDNACDMNVKSVIGSSSSRKRQLSEGGVSGLICDSMLMDDQFSKKKVIQEVKHEAKKPAADRMPPPLPPHGAKQLPPPVPPPPVPPHNKKNEPPPVPPHGAMPTPPPPPKPPLSTCASTSLPLLLTRLSLSQISLKRKSSSWSLEAIDGDEDVDTPEGFSVKTESSPAVSLQKVDKEVSGSSLRRGHNFPTVSSRLSPPLSPSPPSSSDGETWNSHHMHFMKTPKLSHDHVVAGSIGSAGSADSGKSQSTNENSSCPSARETPVEGDEVLESPMALVEKKSRSRKCLSFISPSVHGPSKKSSLARRSSALRRVAVHKNYKLMEDKERGDLEVAVYANNGLLTVHVIQARNLPRDLSGKPCCAYVKVSMVPMGEDRTFHRTGVVQPEVLSSSSVSSSPPSEASESPSTRYLHRFDHKFSFEVLQADNSKRVLISVWSAGAGGADKRRNHFLGCTSFAVKNAIKKDIRGAFRLLSQSSGRIRNVPALCPSSSMATGHKLDDDEDDDGTDELEFSVDDGESDKFDRRSRLKKVEHKDTNGYAMEIGKASTSRDAGAVASTSASAPASVLEDNSFLRHLELEAEDDEDEEEGEGSRERSTRVRLPPRKGPSPKGRTPFTTTRRLIKPPGGTGFGFSVAWTQPPRVERVESGLPADKAGLRAGDLVIFVGERNVVTMPEDEILSLIRSCRDHLTLEVYRRIAPNGVVGSASTSRLASSATLPTHRIRATGSPAPRRPTSFPCGSHVSESHDTGEESAFDGDISGGSGAGGDGARRRPRRLQLPQQVTFNAESARRRGPGGLRGSAAGEPQALSAEESRRRAALQLVGREQSFALAMHFGVTRFLRPLAERRDLITTQEHQVLFQNAEELLSRTEDLLDQLVHDDADILGNCIGKVYLKKVASLSSCYGRYCSGLKQADCLLAQKTRSQDFLRHVMEPTLPRRRPDLTAFIHKPLQHFREVLKLLQTILHHTKVNDDDYAALAKVVQEFQATYREITVGGGMMEPDVEGRPPLLSLQDLESRLVFTRCKPFVLNSGGRQWIFGGDLSRVDGRSVRPYWALLFTDLLLLAKVSRDRVLFVTEEPIPLLNVTRAFFNIRKKDTEFRLLLDSDGGGKGSLIGSGLGSTSGSVTAVSSCVPHSSSSAASTASTVQAGHTASYCSSASTLPLNEAAGALSGSRTGLRIGVGCKGRRRRSVVLRAPTPELKAVWTNLIQRQIIFLNTARGGTPTGSPLDSPDPYSQPSLLGSSANLPGRTAGIHHSLPSHGGRRVGSPTADDLGDHDDGRLEEVEEEVHNAEGGVHQEKRFSRGSVYGGVAQSPSGSIPSPGRRMLEDYIDQKCRLLGKSRSSRGSAIHLQQWMRGQLGGIRAFEEVENVDDLGPVWSPETLRKRSEELRLTVGGAPHGSLSPGRGCESRCEEVELSDTDGSPSRSTDGSQVQKQTQKSEKVTVRSTSGKTSNAKEDSSKQTVSVCRQCHETCLNSKNGTENGRKGVDFVHKPCSSSSHLHHHLPQPKEICERAIKGKEDHCQDDVDDRDLTAEEKALKAMTAAVEGEDDDEDDEDEEDWKSMIPTSPTSAIDPFTPDTQEKTAKSLSNSPVERNKTDEGTSYRDAQKVRARIIPREISIEEVPDNVIKTEKAGQKLSAVAAADSASSSVCIPLPVIEVQPPTPDTNRTVVEGSVAGGSWKSEVKGGSGSGSVADGEEDVDRRSGSGDGDPPYKSLSSGLKKYGTLNSLERVGSDDEEEDEEEGEGEGEEEEETESSGSGGVEGKGGESGKREPEKKAMGISVPASASGGVKVKVEAAAAVVAVEVVPPGAVGAVRESLRGWTARAGSFVAEKMQLFERLSEEARCTSALMEREKEEIMVTTITRSIHSDGSDEEKKPSVAPKGTPNGNSVRPLPAVQVHSGLGSSGGLLARPIHSHHHQHQTSCLLPYSKRGSMSDPPSSPSPEDVTPPSGETTDREDAWGTPTSGEMEFFPITSSTTSTIAHGGAISSGFGGGGEGLAALASSSHWLPGNGDDDDDDNDDDIDDADDDVENDDDDDGVELADDLVAIDGGVSASVLSMIAPPRGIFPRRRLEPLPEEEEPPMQPQVPKQTAPKPPAPKAPAPKAPAPKAPVPKPPPRRNSSDSNGTGSDQGTASGSTQIQRPERRRRRRGGGSGLGGLSAIPSTRGVTSVPSSGVTAAQKESARCEGDVVFRPTTTRRMVRGAVDDEEAGGASIGIGGRFGRLEGVDGGSIRKIRLGRRRGWPRNRQAQSQSLRGKTQKLLGFLSGRRTDDSGVSEEGDRRFWKQLKRRRNGAMASSTPSPPSSTAAVNPTSSTPMYI